MEHLHKTSSSMWLQINIMRGTKVQTVGVISDSIAAVNTMSHARAHTVYPLDRAKFLADWWHQQVAFRATLDCTSASPWCTGQLVAKAERRAAEVSGGYGRDAGGGALRVRVHVHKSTYIHMLTPLIDGLGHATWSVIVPVSRSPTPSF